VRIESGSRAHAERGGDVGPAAALERDGERVGA
jgi:hypothetical protein